ncbi:class I SAM-dependent methyltransferase [Pararhizobium gei]|uniref:class I SAM-dependent methyltransferase n=1 Tax=Pararhizobium gei TaxID=1395951 RepID=UPI0023DCE71A|nr:class I SAM-dependent methyltransferase [Rhizobium gei]
MALSLQKICDIYDFFDPEIDAILRDDLKSTPFGSRRAWEFAMIFRALRQKGKIRPDAHGLAMGAGTERLIYTIVPRVAKTIVTDLYLPDSGWVGVRTDNPTDLVVQKAPWPIDRTKFDAMAMDMRALEFPDDSFDFCWSTGSFEHIGTDEDFLRHFREVERVLKPGGVYAFTTAVTFGGVTEPIPHNYYFDPNHLVDLIHQSPLHAEPFFDCFMREHTFNHPHPERLQDYGLSAVTRMSKPIISFRRGVVLTANIMVLTKTPGRVKIRPHVVGLQATSERLNAKAEAFVKDLWSSFQYIETSIDKKEIKAQPQVFGDGEVVVDIILPPGSPRSLKWSVKRRAISSNYSWANEAQGKVTPDAGTFRFSARRDSVYSIKLSDWQSGDLSRIVMKAKRA